MEYIDSVGKSGSQHKIQKLKNLFGLGDLEYFDDFARYQIDILIYLKFRKLTFTKCTGEWTLAMAIKRLYYWLLGILSILRLH